MGFLSLLLLGLFCASGIANAVETYKGATGCQLSVDDHTITLTSPSAAKEIFQNIDRMVTVPREGFAPTSVYRETVHGLYVTGGALVTITDLQTDGLYSVVVTDAQQDINLSCIAVKQ